MTRRNSDVEVSQTPLWNQHCLVTLTVLMGTPPCHQAFFCQWLFIHHEHHGWRSPRSKNPLLDLQKLSSNQYKEVCVSGNVFINDAVLKIKEYSSLPAPWCQTIPKGSCWSLALPHCAPWPGSSTATSLSPWQELQPRLGDCSLQCASLLLKGEITSNSHWNPIVPRSQTYKEKRKGHTAAWCRKQLVYDFATSGL